MMMPEEKRKKYNKKNSSGKRDEIKEMQKKTKRNKRKTNQNAYKSTNLDILEKKMLLNAQRPMNY